MFRSLTYELNQIPMRELNTMVKSYRPDASYIVNSFTHNYNYIAFKFKDCSPALSYASTRVEAFHGVKLVLSIPPSSNV
jgi:hypothetical protein